MLSGRRGQRSILQKEKEREGGGGGGGLSEKWSGEKKVLYISSIGKRKEKRGTKSSQGGNIAHFFFVCRG